MSSRSAVENKETDIPEKLFDAGSNTVYNRLRFFGKVRNSSIMLQKKIL